MYGRSDVVNLSRTVFITCGSNEVHFEKRNLELVVLALHVHVKGSTGVDPL